MRQRLGGLLGADGSRDPISKILNTKNTQVIECLPSKCEIRNFNPNTAHKKKKKKKLQRFS
jgi:hypothetical protein